MISTLTRGSVWAVCLLFVFSSWSGAADRPKTSDAPAQVLPAAGDIIARFVKEIGGEAAFQKISSQRMKGKIDMAGQGLSGDLEVLARRPDKLIIKISVPGIGDLLQGYDGKVGWSLNPVTGPMILEGKMLDQVKEQARFDAALHDRAQFKSMQTVARTQHEGKDAYQLKLVRKSGQETIEFYDVQTGLLIGSSEVQETPLGAIAVTAAVADYKKFGDLLYATRLTQKMGPLSQVMTFDTMEFDTVDESAFELPAQIKTLVKK